MFSGLGQPPRLSFPAFLWQASLSSPAACQPQLMQLPPPTLLQGPGCCTGPQLPPPTLSPTFLFKKLTPPPRLWASITPMYLSLCLGKRLPRQHGCLTVTLSPLSLSVSTWKYLCLLRSPCLSLSPLCAALSSLPPLLYAEPPCISSSLAPL